MDQFEYVMVLVSIIIGLGITHLLLGIGGIIDRLASKRQRLELSLAHGAWLGQMFVWMVLFWWWEFRFSELQTQWTLGIYFFLVLYSVALFLLAVILVPRTWDGVDSLNEYFWSAASGSTLSSSRPAVSTSSTVSSRAAGLTSSIRTESDHGPGVTGFSPYWSASSGSSQTRFVTTP